MINEVFRHLLWLIRYKQKFVKVDVFGRGCVTLSANFRWKGTLPTNLRWYQKTRVTALSCGIKIQAVCCLILSQSTHVTYRKMDRIMTPKTALALLCCTVKWFIAAISINGQKGGYSIIRQVKNMDVSASSSSNRQNTNQFWVAHWSFTCLNGPLRSRKFIISSALLTPIVCSCRSSLSEPLFSVLSIFESMTNKQATAILVVH